MKILRKFYTASDHRKAVVKQIKKWRDEDRENPSNLEIIQVSFIDP